MRGHLVLFLRRPRLGVGKRRLARQIGDVTAVAFERRMIALLLRRLAGDRRWIPRLAVTPDRAAAEARRWRRGLAVVAQGQGDLGRRMQRMLACCPAGPVVLVGADIPGLEARHVMSAFRQLGRHDLVFGPAADGGFWLVGARQTPRLPALFRNVRWSTPYALADALAGLPRGVSVGFVDRLEDVDDVDGWRRLAPRRGF